MKIELFVGDGWTPFDERVGNEQVAFHLTDPNDRLDVPASTRALAERLETRVRELYPDADVIVSPPHPAGKLAVVSEIDPLGDAADEALVLDAQELQDPGFDAAEIIAGEIEGQLAGIVEAEPTHWQVGQVELGDDQEASDETGS